MAIESHSIVLFWIHGIQEYMTLKDTIKVEHKNLIKKTVFPNGNSFKANSWKMVCYLKYVVIKCEHTSRFVKISQ